jgi:hypothetical protein
VRKLATKLVPIWIAVVLFGAAVGDASAVDYAAPHPVAAGQMRLKLVSTMPGVTFDGDTLVCPAILITTSSGANHKACEFTIENSGGVQPDLIVVNMSVSGISAAQASAGKFAVDPHPGPLVFFQTTSQQVYEFSGSQIPVTVAPGVVWGANAGSPLDDSDLGAVMTVTYAVVAEAVGGATSAPGPTQSPFESFAGETATPKHTSTPPPTEAVRDSSGNTSTPELALLICLLLAGLGLGAVESQRRSVRR